MTRQLQSILENLRGAIINGLPDSLGYIGYAIAVIAGVFSYINRDRYKTLINDIYKPGNQELREQLATARQEITDLSSQKTTLQAQVTEKDNRIKDLKELNAQLPNYGALTQATSKVITTLSDNHREILSRLTELAKKAIQ